MDAALQEIVDALKTAVQAEGDGYHFYMMAAASTKDPQGKAVFETLAREEQEHARYLKSQYRALLETGRTDPRARLGTRLDLTGPSPIFSAELRSRAGQAHYEMSALSIGMQLELGAAQFYRSLAGKATEPALKQVLIELCDWETGHYEALQRQQGALRDDYFAEGGFSPF
jgi:rubrerythrin